MWDKFHQEEMESLFDENLALVICSWGNIVTSQNTQVNKALKKVFNWVMPLAVVENYKVTFHEGGL